MHDQHEAPGLGHNAPRLRQWQTPHLPHDHVHAEEAPSEPDLDLVEAAFAEGFATASDPTSFLRLAGIPFVAGGPDGGKLGLLRVELDSVTDVGSLTPTLGGGSFRYDPLPAKLVSRRRRLRFVYQDGTRLLGLSFMEARALSSLMDVGTKSSWPALSRPSSIRAE
jgi:hypothetical protein